MPGTIVRRGQGQRNYFSSSARLQVVLRSLALRLRALLVVSQAESQFVSGQGRRGERKKEEREEVPDRKRKSGYTCIRAAGERERREKETSETK